jgi:class 3 adenylate cyclase/tetratricopeptide (TPR) repeat protein
VTAPPAPVEPSAERRLVSVLFADLVGFTTLSESRDAEEVRELLTRYFDSCKRLISLYGGTVEKFIGDAVMAVWGTPIAQEDDAERAVRAALDLVAAVSALGDEVGAPELRARAGVLTGEAAVTIGAEGQGMVAGDLVNTASRIQASAEPGSVLVGESTRRASEAAIAYADAGSHELKGKAEPVPLFRGLRVIASRGGALKAQGLEPPFVGRDRELRLVKELLHASAEEKKAHLVSVMGIAGIGKSRLAWELEKYVDGLAEALWWWRGRCLAYGEGVSYWALAEMVRTRADIVEGEDPRTARAKLSEALEPYVPDAEERSWIEPRLAQLLGLGAPSGHEREDLFAAWRLYFERLSEFQPAVLVFEDVHWADPSLLEFIEYLLEWSRNHPIFVVLLSRPELADRHPGWGAGKRNLTSISLEPLSEAAMASLLTGLVPGLADELRRQILASAEGVPLYAVETVRMLLDRGLLERAGDGYRTTGPIETLEVPETLHALVAARLDGLSPDERRLVQDASVLGKSFSKEGLVAVGGASTEELEQLLQGLVRKEVFTVQADPRSPERGQYSFLQDLLKRVAYDTLAKRERKARHLAAAAFLEQAFGAAEQEIVEVVAAHYVDAYEAAPEADDAGEIRAKAQGMLDRAGERAASVAAKEEAERYFEQAAELADEPLVQARLLERAGEMAWTGARGDFGRDNLERSQALFEAEGETHQAARVAARLGEIAWGEGHIDQAVAQMEESFDVLASDQPDADLGALAAQLGRFHWFMGHPDDAAERIERALDIAEALSLPEVLSQALNTKALVLMYSKGRPEEGRALLRHSLTVALENDVPSAALRAYNNLAELLWSWDQLDAGLSHTREGLELARRMGDRRWELSLLVEIVQFLFSGGEWDEALERAEELGDLTNLFASGRFAAAGVISTIPQIHAARGEIREARNAVEPYEEFGESADVQEQGAYHLGLAAVLLAERKFEAALRAATSAVETGNSLGFGHANFKLGFGLAMEAALALDDLETAAELLATADRLGAGAVTPHLRGQRSRFEARLAAVRGEDERVEGEFKSAAALFRQIGVPFPLGVTLLEHGEWLAGQDRVEEAEPLFSEARELFQRLEAKPWLERLARASGAELEAVSGS